MIQPDKSPETAYRLTAATRLSSVRLLLRDADTAVAMWEVTGADVDAARQQLGPFDTTGELVLRIRAWSTGEPARTWEVPVQRWLESRFVPLSAPEWSHQVVLGLRDPGESASFVAIARSNVLRAGRVEGAAGARFASVPPAPADGEPLAGLEVHEDTH